MVSNLSLVDTQRASHCFETLCKFSTGIQHIITKVMRAISEQSDNSIVYRIATAYDRDNILEFLRKHYYPEEPITNGNEPRIQDDADEEFILSVISDGASIVAIDSVNNWKIVGALMAGHIESNESELVLAAAKEFEMNNNRKWSEILRLVGHISQCAKIFQRYNVNKSLQIHAIGVDASYRRKSIGTNLMKACFDVGKKLEFPIVSMDCTSVFSIEMAEKLDMDCVNVQAFKDFRDINGRQMFNPPPPNTHIKSFVKIL